MNGVRRFLAATGSSSSSPSSTGLDSPSPKTTPVKLIPLNGPSWPPQTPITQTPITQPPISPSSLQQTPPLFARDPNKQKPQPPEPPPDGDPSTTFLSPDSPTSTVSTASTSRLQINRMIRRKAPPQTQPPPEIDWRWAAGGSVSLGPNTVRDELLISLLASEAVVDSRDFDILSSEQIDDLKKEHQVLTSRLEAMSKKLILETKIRDAAVSLSKVNAAHKKISKQTDEQLEAANRRVDAAQKEFWRVSKRAYEVHIKLMQHRAGVLSYSVRSMEKMMGTGSMPNGDGDDSGYDSKRSTLMSPITSSVTSSSTASSKARFDGLHFFAGHADSIVPRRNLSSEEAVAEITALEAKMKMATEALMAAGKKQAELTRELSITRLEKQEVEVLMGMDLQSAEETINALEKELPRLEGLDAEVRILEDEKRTWQEERVRLEEQVARLEILRTKDGAEAAAGMEKLLIESRRMVEEKEKDIRRIIGQWHGEREVWERQKAEAMEDKLDDLARLQNEMDTQREEDARALQHANDELDNGLSVLEALVKQHGITLLSRNSSLQSLLSSVRNHLDTVHGKLDAYGKAETEWEAMRRKLEDDIQTEVDQREMLVRELEDTRHERDDVRNELCAAPKDMSAYRSSVPDSIDHIIQILIPVWNILPSPEARAAKFNQSRQFRTGSGTPGSPPLSPSQLGSPGIPKVVMSLSELDVRSLKLLYEVNRSTGGQFVSTTVGGGDFSIEALASRVRALVQDDRALIERLVRFAQAHDLLKKNAERAQKLAQEGNTALETYQKQVRTLEERNTNMAARQAIMQDELLRMQDMLERIEDEKRKLETFVAEQTEICQQLTDANNALSARTLTLAEEAVSAPEMVRKQLEAKLTETNAALEAARDEVVAMRTSEQSQRIALLDELNSMQTENGVLRAQLRARK